MKFTETEMQMLTDIASKLSEFGAYIRQHRAEEILKEYNLITDSTDFKIRSGASKYVIVFKKHDYVIKWSTDNSVKKEAEIYDSAVHAKLDFVFPETIFLGTYESIPYSVQSKIDYSAEEIPNRHKSKYLKMSKTVTWEIQEKMERGFQIPNCGYNRELDLLWSKVFISLYGKAVAKKLCTFIRAHRINDLHTSNIGFLKQRPIILDFCGYEND